MDFHSLRVFLTVAETGSFSLAAERLFLTQPAISKRIANLEQELEVRLFDRIGRQIQLTEAGRELLPRAEGLLESLADLRRSIGNLAGRVTGVLTMGTSHHIGLHRLPPVLKAFSRDYPEVQLDIRFLDSESACREVELGRLELAVVTLPPSPLAHLDMQVLWNDPLHFVVARDHPLTRLPNPSLADLLRSPAVLPAPATYTRDILEQALRRRRLTLRVGMTTNYLETIRMLAATGLGWALLPATMLGPGLIVLEFPEIRLGRRLGTVTHTRRTPSNAARAMLKTCLEHADSPQAPRSGSG